MKKDEIRPSEEMSSWTRFASNDYVNIDDSIQPASARHDWADDAMNHQSDPTWDLTAS